MRRTLSQLFPRTRPSRKAHSPASTWLKQWRGKLQLMLEKKTSAFSVLVLPVPRSRKGRRPAAVNISSGMVEQR